MIAGYDKVKSTWDNYCRSALDSVNTALRAANVLQEDMAFADIDDVVTSERAIKSDKPMVGWGIEDARPAPREPMFAVLLRFAVRIPSDASNTVQTRVISEFESRFKYGTSIVLRNYFDQTSIDSGDEFGRMMLVDGGIGPAAADSNAAVRELRIEARGICR